MSVKHYLNSLARVALAGGVTPVQHLQRLSEYLQRDISIKRDDISHPGMGGNKLRKLEFLAADAISKGQRYAGDRRGGSVEPCTANRCGSRAFGSEVRSAAGESHSNRRA